MLRFLLDMIYDLLKRYWFIREMHIYHVTLVPDSGNRCLKNFLPLEPLSSFVQSLLVVHPLGEQRQEEDMSPMSTDSAVSTV